MPNSEFLRDLIMTVVFLIPVLGLVWKGATLAAELKALKDKVKESVSSLQDRFEQERVATDSSIAAIMATLTEIQKSIVRVETKLDTKESK